MCALIIGACMTQLHAAKRRRQAVLGSTVPAAGSPNLPSFSLSNEQTASLPPIHPDIYQDTLLSAVRVENLFYQINFQKLNCVKYEANPIIVQFNSHFCHINAAMRQKCIESLPQMVTF